MTGNSQKLSKPTTLPVNNWHRTANLISNLTAPPLLAVPTYLILGLYDQTRNKTSTADLLFGLAVSIFLGVIFPIAMVFFLRNRQIISDIHISIREQRTIPYVGAIIAYFLAFILIYIKSGPGILAAIMFCYAVNSLIVMCINFGWKVSAHATGVGGPLAALTFIFGWSIVPLYLLIPIVNWARVYIKAHTPGQVIVGTSLGLGLTLLQLGLIFRPLGWI